VKLPICTNPLAYVLIAGMLPCANYHNETSRLRCQGQRSANKPINKSIDKQINRYEEVVRNNSKKKHHDLYQLEKRANTVMAMSVKFVNVLLEVLAND